MSGFTKDARAYEVVAESAAQDLTNPDFIELQTIHAKVGMQDKSTMEMTAVSGLYNSKTEMLKLQQKIVLTSSTGYKGLLSEATIDIRKGYVVSEHPVELEMLPKACSMPTSSKSSTPAKRSTSTTASI